MEQLAESASHAGAFKKWTLVGGELSTMEFKKGQDTGELVGVQCHQKQPKIGSWECKTPSGPLAVKRPGHLSSGN
jgi:hypothetical protein